MKLKVECLDFHFPEYPNNNLTCVHYRRLHGMVWTYHSGVGLNITYIKESGKDLRVEIND